MGSEEEERSLIEDELILIQHESNGLYTKDGSVDIHGKPVLKSSTGNWRACLFILGTECGQYLAFNGVSRNLVLYLTSKLHEGNVSAATNVTTWTGACHLTPLVGAVLADAYWGRYWTIVVFSTIYFIGMCMLTLFASVPTLMPAECVGLICPPATPAQRGIFFSALYLITLGNGGIRPCVSSFGADQFDEIDPKERVKKGSFFNWFYFSSNIGSIVSSSLIVWIQENTGWGLGFGIPSLFMGLAIASFLLGTCLYRFQRPEGSPITRMCQVVVASFWKHKCKVPEDSTLLYETSDKYSAKKGSQKLEHTDELKCLDKAAVLLDDDVKTGNFNPWKLCTITQVEEMKILIHMFPIWASVIMYSVVWAQSTTTFVEQGLVMDRTVGSFKIPAASLSIFYVISGIIWVPIYDKILVPIARNFTGEERGFSTLQRMGIGLFFSILSMIAAALVEIRRLELARELGLVNKDEIVPLDIFWQIPQYFLLASANLFTYVGKIEFFYDQSPDTMRSFCSALMLLIISMGDYLSSFIFTVVTTITTVGGKTGWIPDNLNEGHLDYFFWLLAGLSFVNMLVYVFCAKNYKRKKASM